MSAEQLEELLGKVARWWEIGAFGSTGHVVIDNNQNPICVCLNDDEYDTHATLIALAPSLARKVLAAEKVVHEVRAMMNAYHSGKDIYGWADAVSEAIETWEALK